MVDGFGVSFMSGDQDGRHRSRSSGDRPLGCGYLEELLPLDPLEEPPESELVDLPLS